MNSRKIGRRGMAADYTMTDESFAVQAKDYNQVSFLLDENASFDMAMRGGASTIWDTPREPLQQRSVSPDPVKLNFTPMKKFKARISRVSVGAPPDLAQENEEEDEIKEEQPAASESLVKAPFGEISNSLKQSFGWSGKVPSKKTTTETKEVVKDVEPVASKSEPAESNPTSKDHEPTEKITTQLSSIDLNKKDEPEPQVPAPSLASSILNKKPESTINFPKATIPKEFNFAKPENRTQQPVQRPPPFPAPTSTFTRVKRHPRAPVAGPSSDKPAVNNRTLEDLGEAVASKLRVAPKLDALEEVCEAEPQVEKKEEQNDIPQADMKQDKGTKRKPHSAAPSKVGEVVEEKPAIPSKTAKPLTQPPNANVSDKEEEEEEIIVIQPSARVAANTEPSQNTGAARIFTIVAPSPVKASRPLSLEPVEPEAALNTSTKKRSLEADLPIESKEQVRAPSRAAPAKRPRVDTEISSSSAPVSSLKNSGRLGSTQPHRLSKFRIVSAPARMMTASSAAKVRAAPRQIAKPDEKPASAAPLQPTVSKAFTFTTDLRLESRKPPVPVQPRKPIVFEPKVIPDFALLHAALPPNAQYKAPTKPKPKPSTLPSDGPLNLKLGFKPTVPHTPRLSTIVRARERAEFDKHMKEKEEARHQELEKERQERIKREEEEEKALRKYIDAIARENVHEVPKFYKDRKATANTEDAAPSE